MKNLISFKIASNFLLLIYCLLIVFHLLMIIGAGFYNFIPIDIVWGGKIKDQAQLINFELIALFVSSICLILTIIKIKYKKNNKLKKVSHYFMWLAFAYFLINTLGNILATTNFEKSLAIVTILISLFSLRLALEKEKR